MKDYKHSKQSFVKFKKELIDSLVNHELGYNLEEILSMYHLKFHEFDAQTKERWARKLEELEDLLDIMRQLEEQEKLERERKAEERRQQISNQSDTLKRQQHNKMHMEPANAGKAKKESQVPLKKQGGAKEDQISNNARTDQVSSSQTMNLNIKTKGSQPPESRNAVSLAGEVSMNSSNKKSISTFGAGSPQPRQSPAMRNFRKNLQKKSVVVQIPEQDEEAVQDKGLNIINLKMKAEEDKVKALKIQNVQKEYQSFYKHNIRVSEQRLSSLKEIVTQYRKQLLYERALAKSLEQKKQRRSVKSSTSAAAIKQMIQEKIQEMMDDPTAEKKQQIVEMKKQDMLRPSKLTREIFSYADMQVKVT